MVYFYTVRTTGFYYWRHLQFLRKLLLLKGIFIQDKYYLCEFSRLQEVRSFNYTIQEGIFHLHKSLKSTYYFDEFSRLQGSQYIKYTIQEGIFCLHLPMGDIQLSRIWDCCDGHTTNVCCKSLHCLCYRYPFLLILSWQIDILPGKGKSSLKRHPIYRCLFGTARKFLERGGFLKAASCKYTRKDIYVLWSLVDGFLVHEGKWRKLF